MSLSISQRQSASVKQVKVDVNAIDYRNKRNYERTFMQVKLNFVNPGEGKQSRKKRKQAGHLYSTTEPSQYSVAHITKLRRIKYQHQI